MYGHLSGGSAAVAGAGALASTGVNLAVPIVIASLALVIGGLLVLRDRMLLRRATA